MRYDPFADPVVNEIRAYRPCYVSKRILAELEVSGDWRRVCRLGGATVSIEAANGAWVRRREPWGSDRDFEAAVAWWQCRKQRAPSSPAGLVVAQAPRFYGWQPWSLQESVVRALAGAWQEAQVVGTILGPHRVYDMRRAYLWAATCGDFPERDAMSIAYRYDDRQPGLHTVTLEPGWSAAPWPLKKGGRQLLQIPDDLIYGRPPIVAWHGGLFWERTRNLEPLLDLVRDIPNSACQRAFWGPWIAQTPVVTTFKSGVKTKLPARGLNVAWAHCVLSRVRRRLAAITTHYRYVDSVITRVEDGPVTGPRIGDWRVVREYLDGVKIDYAGCYGPPEGPPDKQAGVRRVA